MMNPRKVAGHFVQEVPEDHPDFEGQPSGAVAAYAVIGAIVVLGALVGYLLMS